MGLPKAVHATVAAASFAGALASLVVAVQLGAVDFIVENVWDGLMTDFLGGIFLEPLWMAGLFGLPILPAILVKAKAPTPVLVASCLVGFPFAIIFIAVIIEALVVLLPTGAAVGSFALLGLVEADHAQGKKSSVLKMLGGGKRKKGKGKGKKEE